MKTRSGFVSNSSSTSFMVAVRDEEDAKATIEVDLVSHARSTIRTKEELDEYFKIDLGYDSLDDDLYKEALKCIEDGKIVLSGSFHDDTGSPEDAFLCHDGLEGNVDDSKVDVLISEAGY